MERIHLASHPHHVCEFLGYDYGVWQQGFQTMHDVFRFICSSTLFTPAIFASLNRDHRHRAVSRPFYGKFLDFINVDAASIQHASERRGEVIFSIQSRALAHFNKHGDLQRLQAAQAHRKERSRKFNGSLFTEYRLVGKALGTTIRQFKEQQGLEDFDGWVDAHTAEQIQECVRLFCAAAGLATHAGAGAGAGDSVGTVEEPLVSDMAAVSLGNHP